MPREKRVPSYRLHRSSGQARVIIDGKHVYLGPYGSPQSREMYAKLIAERFMPGTGWRFAGLVSAALADVMLLAR